MLKHLLKKKKLNADYWETINCKQKIEVPDFRGFYPTEEDMDKNQRKFYLLFEKALEKEKYYDLNGNMSYLFVYLYKLIANWKKRGFKELSEYLIYLSEIYKSEVQASEACLYWAYDCLLGLERFEEYLEKTEPNKIFGTLTHISNLRLNIQKKIGEKANVIDILLMIGGRKSKFIVNNQVLYKEKIISRFTEYGKENNTWFNVFDNWRIKGGTYEHRLFSGVVMWNLPPALSFKIKGFYSAYDQIYIVKDLAREAENMARKEKGVPLVGEGWISETELFKKLEKEFSMTTVIQHGHPSFLGRQHFDIWFPHWKIAVEYHGKQHFEPVEFFGGQEAFKKNIERDKRKINLSKINKVRLFVVTEDSDQDFLIESIYKHMNSRKIKVPNT
ncbi:MAG: hypothetical protein GXP61_01625 [Epsilonproteobacteria bacterium]|nr:hypothetical protein [Campylobacterota bacterium]